MKIELLPESEMATRTKIKKTAKPKKTASEKKAEKKAKHEQKRKKLMWLADRGSINDFTYEPPKEESELEKLIKDLEK